MPGGHASHKGTSNKPNTNAEGKLDTAADESVNPMDLVDNTSTRTDEAMENAQATERPSNAPQSGYQDS